MHVALESLITVVSQIRAHGHSNVIPTFHYPRSLPSVLVHIIIISGWSHFTIRIVTLSRFLARACEASFVKIHASNTNGPY